MTPDKATEFLAANLCPVCELPLSTRRLRDNGITHCPKCGEGFVVQENALTYIDEIPVSEFIGG